MFGAGAEVGDDPARREGRANRPRPCPSLSLSSPSSHNRHRRLACTLRAAALTADSACGCLEFAPGRRKLSSRLRLQGVCQCRASWPCYAETIPVPQPKLHWSAYLWPGLPQVWLRGSWVGLALAVGFTALANVLLAATLRVGRVVARAGALDRRWGRLAVIWVVAWIDGRADWRRLLAEWSAGEARHQSIPTARSDQWFREAQAAYLAGDWVSAEQTLLKLLRHDARDAESRLMLATLWRHEGRLEAAAEELDHLELLETAAPWRNEMAWERERIRAASVEMQSQDGPTRKLRRFVSGRRPARWRAGRRAPSRQTGEWRPKP